MRHALSMTLIFALLSAGCSDTAGPQAAASGDSADVKQTTGYTGKWLVIVSRMDAPRESHIAIVDIAKTMGGKFVGKVVDNSDAVFPEASIAKTEVGKDGIHLEFKVGDRGELNVNGTLDGDTIYGNAPTSNGLQPLRMVRTKDDEITGPDTVKIEGADTFIAAIESEDRVKALQEFTKEFKTSPAAMGAYLALLKLSKEEELDEAAVTKIINGFVEAAGRWGQRMKRNAQLDAAAILVQVEYLPDLAIKTLEPLEKNSGENDADISSRLTLYGSLARLNSTDEETRKMGESVLKQMHKHEPLNHRFRVALARHHDTNGDKKQALQLYTELAMLPDGDRAISMLNRGVDGPIESANEASLRIWKSLHAKAEGHAEYRDQIYDKTIKQLFGEPDTATPANRAGKQVALCELFTGSACPPCVAADLATVGIEANYPSSSVIVLRYHQHIPRPDPLANADGETRFFYYEPEGTPTVILNGRPVRGIGGRFGDSRFMFDVLRKKVDDVIDADSNYSIRLSADAKDGELSIDAAVTDVKNLPKTARLRMVLAEESISFNARNGVQRHEMVVRYMPGGAEGVGIDNDQLAYKSSIKLATIKQELTDHLDKIAKQYDQPRRLPPQVLQQMPNGPFPVRPLELNPLRLVAFIQDDETQKVLQAASIPVEGELVYPGVDKTEDLTPPGPSDDDPDRPVVAPVPKATAEKPKAGPAIPPAPKADDKKEPESPKSGPKLISPGNMK